MKKKNLSDERIIQLRNLVNNPVYMRIGGSMVMSHSRGHKIYFDGQWRYLDNGQIVTNERECIRCGKKPTKEGHDSCLAS
jgi:hypothetical protein